MKKLIAFILLAFLTEFVLAQENYIYAVHLQNGNVVRGLVIEQVPNTTLKVETADKRVFVFRMHEVEKIVREEGSNFIGPPRAAKVKKGLKKGFRSINEIGYQLGLGDYEMHRLEVNLINGIQFSPYFYLGAGVGLRYYLEEEAAVVPVFIHPRLNFIDAKFSPYVAFSGGYSLNASRDFKGLGYLLSPSAGITYVVSRKVNLNLGLSYEMQMMNFYHTDSSGNYIHEEKDNSTALSINFGISF